jgi:solute:Na+ symporter, SSS family
MALIDWVLMGIPLSILFWIGWRAQRYMRGVSDFLAAGRVADRYVVAVSAGEASFGLIAAVAIFEQLYKGGPAFQYWQSMLMPAGIIVTLLGFVIYRYRETKAMTLAQFFEMRYSRNFRVAAGMVCFLAGIINYGLFPGVSARFIIYFCKLPPEVSFAGITVPTLAVVMLLMLGIALVIVNAGGQITTMVTDCVQGLVTYIVYAAVVVAVLLSFSMDQFRTAMLSRPPGQSFVDPFDTGQVADFNILFVLIGLLGMIYGRMAWQGNQAYNASASSPHEQKMGGILGNWRGGFGYLVFALLVFGTLVVMVDPEFSHQAGEIRSELAERVSYESEAAADTIENQMLVPVAARHILPVGLVGLFAVAMVFLMLSTDTTYLHSWGSIFIQDIVLPLRRRPFAPHTQILLLRLSITGVAVFAFLFSLFYNQTTYIFMFWALTGAIYIGGAGACIIGGLYWRKGTAAGAWWAMFTGVGMAAAGFFLQHQWKDLVHPWMLANTPAVLEGFRNALHSLSSMLPIVHWEFTPEKFPISGQEWYFLTILAASAIYSLVSLLTCRKPFDLDRMLHRGRWDTSKEHHILTPTKMPWWQRTVGIDPEYTTGDKILAWSLFGWLILQFGLFLMVLVWNLLFHRWPEDWFFEYWKRVTLPMFLIYGIVTSIWFFFGGTRGLIRLFRALRAHQPDVNDDGRVQHDKQTP